MKKIVSNIISRQFAVFLLFGGIASLINFFSRFIYNIFTSYGVAVFLAAITGIIASFVFFKYLVFQGRKNRTKAEIIYFLVINFIASVLTYLISVFFAYYIFPFIGFTFYPYSVAHILGIGLPSFFTFFSHKYLSFKE